MVSGSMSGFGTEGGAAAKVELPVIITRAIAAVTTRRCARVTRRGIR